LFKLKQGGIVVEYQAAFEKIGNKVMGLPAEAMLNCFISGLIPEIRNELVIQKPYNISQAIELAKLIESKIKDTKPKFHNPFTPNTPPIPNLAPSKSFPPKQPTSLSQQTNTSSQPTPTNNPKLPIRRLSPTQMQERRALGLCYNWDEKYIIGHKCSTGRYLLLILEPAEVFEDDETLPDTQQPLETPNTYFQLSPQALTSTFSPKSLKFKDQIYGLTMTVLIDTEITHNILQPRIASHLQLPRQQTPTFSVMVGTVPISVLRGFAKTCPLPSKKIYFTFPFTFSLLKVRM